MMQWMVIQLDCVRQNADIGRIDILVNNAFDPSVVFSSVVELSAEQLQRNFEMGPGGQT